MGKALNFTFFTNCHNITLQECIFARNKKTRNFKHINNSLNEEFNGFPMVANFAPVQMEF